MIKLQDHINSLNPLPLADKIKAIADLIPGLKAEPPKEYGYFVNHSDYEGTANLNDLGSLWLHCASDCQTEHAPLQVRLAHEQIEDPLTDVYSAGDELLGKALDDGTVICPFDPNTECAHCADYPASAIMAGSPELQAFIFEEEQYKSLWGDDENNKSQPLTGAAYLRGSEYWTKSDGKRVRYATREQIQEALRRSENPTTDVADQA